VLSAYACSADTRVKWWMNCNGHDHSFPSRQGLQEVSQPLGSAGRVDQSIPSASATTWHWVLQDIDFTVNPGEAVGIIGINRRGESTLLKMITGTTQPPLAECTLPVVLRRCLSSAWASIPISTGRQNAFMAGQLLGYGVDEIAHLMPELRPLPKSEDYIDQPVRVYSSGMQMRLAFSVATAHRPDVVDRRRSAVSGRCLFPT